ncbi:MAG: hypothetical protein HZA05_03900 [Nitrospirae bacterium]|nr:hypothetical protein [Nitrospirota bacterium]
MKLLSIATFGRNDNYMGNFNYRLTTSLNYLAHNLKKIGRLDDVEIIVTDWGSEIPLSKVLSLSAEAGSICKFVYVPPVIARDIRHEGIDGSTATNVGLRRGEGEFLIVFPGDTLVPRYSLQTLLNLIDGRLPMPFDLQKMYYFVGRYQLPWEVVQREPDIEEWDQYLLFNTANLLHDMGLSGLGMWGAALMLPREILHACRGCDEKLKGWGWSDADIMLRISQYYPWIDIFNIGVFFYHMEHYRQRTEIPEKLKNPEIVNVMLAVNDENWGLGGHDLEIQKSENICKDSKDEKKTKSGRLTGLQIETIKEILSEITDPTVRDHVKTTFEKIGVDRLNTVYGDDWEYIDVLAWYSLKYYPLYYLEFGIQIPYAASIVASASPGVQIYGIDSWKQMHGLTKVLPPNIAAFQLQKVGYKGYTRYIGGDIHTALRRLHDSSAGGLSIDLALVRGELFGNDALRQITDLIPYINNGGALVYHSGTPLFNVVWNEIKNKYPQFTYLENRIGQYNSGLMFKCQLT